MALDAPVFWQASLCEIELPDRTVRLCDAAFVNWPARGIFRSFDSELGVMDNVTAMSESVGDEAPQGVLTLLPPPGVAMADLFLPETQGKSILFWLAEVSPETGQVVGTPHQIFSGLIDTLKLTGGKRRSVDITFMSDAERLFHIRQGNVLSHPWHQRHFPGETGLKHATGTQTTVPWGTSAPRGQSVIN